jgi:very-short-patch-repair endonuclease/DNA polymerase III delta prime subunit
LTTNIVDEKAKNFFEYLLALNNLVGKVTRDFSEFEKNWHVDEFQELDGCFVLNDCQNEDNILEIHRPNITREDEQPPKPGKAISEWINFDFFNENLQPSYIEEKVIFDGDEEETIEAFTDSNERGTSYNKWSSEWKEWAEVLKEKKRVLKLYEEFFNLISCIEKEGESLEFIYGSGLLCWKHPDGNVGTIRSPLFTTKLELDIDADKGIISAKQVDRTLNFEREMFSGVHIPNINQINQLIRDIQSREITNNLSDFFKQFIHLLDANGQFIEEPEAIKVDENPIIYDHSMFSLRSKSVRVLRDDLEQIISGISTGEIELSETVTAILGEDTKSKEKDSNDEVENGLQFTENNLYFPLESNEQQKEIINRIERHHGVTVQGPPGTGKTHTIANLVSHFLSEGKKILITSQKESPLKVLKNKIPKEIRDLCVPVLGGGRESLQEIEQSIRVIGEKLGELDVRQLEVEINRDKEELNKSKRVEAQLKNQLKSYAEKEGAELHYRGEKLFKYDVAKRLSESTIDYSWIQDAVSIDEKFPLSTTEFKEMWELKNKLTKESLLLKDQFLPIVDTHIQNSAAFSSFIENGQKLLEFDEDGREVVEKFNLPKNEDLLKKLLADFEGILSMSTILDNSDYKSIIEDCKAGGVREQRWRSLLNDIIAANEKMFEHYNNLVTHKINLPQKDLVTLKEDVAIAKERLQTGKKPNLLFFMVKGRQVKYLFDTPVLNGKPLSSIEALKPIEVYLQYIEIKKETARIFNGNMEEIGHASIDENERRFPHLLEERIKELKLVIQVVDSIKAMCEKIKPYNMGNLNLYSVEEISKIVNQVEKAIKHIQYQAWLEEYEKALLQLKEVGHQDKAHPILKEFISAFEMKDVSEWTQLLHSSQLLHDTRETVIRFYELLNLLNNILPLTGKSIELTVGTEQEIPKEHLEAFELRKLHSWLDETKDMNIGLIKKQIDNEHKEQMKLIENIVKNLTWKNQVERITNEEKRALSAWKTYIKRFGKGSGKYAQMHLQGAREEMKTAQSAIPVWIMPISQVLENFPVTNEKFDVIIFDESSQCDLFSINVLLRGKKIIVVGDDEQISPQAIGTNLEDVYELVRRHLPGVPNANLFDGNISLYEISEQTFPKEGKLMLREHFRCVPEIIQFSNDLSYGGEMIPLRLPLEEEKIEPPVVAVKVEDGYNDEKDKDINVPEVEAIVADIVEMIQDPVYDNQTFGVITLQGQKQHKLLETRIREAIGDSEFVKRKVICGNAYTLQGDERDIIFLSMVVAPNRRFRSLVKTSEKQRFNVAASRAKNQMRLYHSVDLEELSSDDLRYRFLSYCKNPTRLNEELANLEEKCESPFELDVLRMIIARGYKVTPQVEVGRYRIDLVVEGLRDRLAVECDGEKWHGHEKFEEDIQRQESLERAGWKFWRVRGREFYFDRTKAMNSLWEQLNEMGIEPFIDHQENPMNDIGLVENVDENYRTVELQEKITPKTNYFEKQDHYSDTTHSSNSGEFKEQLNTGVQTELFDSKLEGFQDQISLFDEDNTELTKPTYKEDDTNKDSNTFSLLRYLKSEGYEVIDQREKGGCIWVVGDENLQPLMKKLERKNITFKFSPNGSRSTKRAPAWYSKYSG